MWTDLAVQHYHADATSGQMGTLCPSHPFESNANPQVSRHQDRKKKSQNSKNGGVRDTYQMKVSLTPKA
jgi:hypothetical protein